MRERPIGDLLDALNQLGADCRGQAREGFPPVVVNARGLRGGRTKVRGDISSQFLSALLMALPLAQGDVELTVEGRLVSQPYVAMTLRIMEAFGARAIASHDFSDFGIPASQNYAARNYAIEPDASAASYFWAAAAITGGEVTVEGLTKNSLQGDVTFVKCLAQMGCCLDDTSDGITVSGRAKRGIEVDMNAISDTVQTLAVVALFAEGPTTIRNVAHIRHKETDRIGDLARELRKLGADVDELPDGLRIVSPADPARLHGAAIETYNDHRMAMSLALAGLRIPGVTILNPGCTAKTYPDYFTHLDLLTK
jgi:3-phosphoshikimate 1-carboxyvinyltransferase